ncbi:MAG: DUF1217 domain-containing protein [Pseudomonadota bacterium]
MFVPAVPLSGYAGWLVFDGTAPKQLEIHERQAEIQRNVEYFRSEIGTADTAEALVNDRRLLTVALGAFGLSDEIDKRAFIERVLSDGTQDPEAFALRLPDTRFRQLSEAFGYGDIGGAQIGSSAFRERVISQYIERSFEVQVGEADTDIRLALNFRRDALQIANGENADDIGFLQILGQRPLRTVLENALGLPQSTGTLDLDRQLEVFQDRFQRFFGVDSISALRDPDVLESVIERFFLNRQLQSGPDPSTPGATAITLLASGSIATNAFLSNAATTP